MRARTIRTCRRPAAQVLLKGAGVFALVCLFLLALFLNVAQAAPGPDAAQRHQEALATVRLYAGTARCMHQSVQAFLRHGVTDRATLTNHAARLCGHPLYMHLQVTAGWSQRDAAELVFGMAEREARATNL